MERRDLSGHVLDGRYRVLEPLGQGGMGSVFRGEHLKLGRIVAIKVMNEQIPNEMSSRRRFEREALAMAKLEHPHCAAVLDVGMHEDQPFVVMDFVSGTSLQQLVEAGPVPVARAVEITRQILSGLAHAHERGVIHRDIKPANIVLSQKSGLGDHVKILDFGLAKLNEESSNLTRGVIIGTPSYMAPEQIRGLLIDPRADVYACGVLLFELLTGTKPFRSANNEPLEVCMMHLNTPPPTLAEALPGHAFGALEAVVARALEKDRDRRYASAGELSAALLAAVGRPAVQTPPAGVAIGPELAAVSGAGATVPLGPSAGLAGVRGDSPTLAAHAHAPAPAIPAASAPAPSAPAGSAPVMPAPGLSAPGLSAPGLSASSTGAADVSRGGASKRPLILVGGVVVLALGAGIAVKVLGGHGEATDAVASAAVADAGTPVGPAPVPPSSDVEDPVAELIARATALADGGRRDTGIDLLVKARRSYPQDGRLPYRAGLMYFDKMWWADGLKQLRAAIQLDPAYRSDPELIKAAIRGFNTTAQHDWTLSSFLRKDIGDAARPYLEETAANHPNPLIRKRAAAELRYYR